MSSHSSVWHQAIIWTNDDLLSIWLLFWGTNTKIWMGIQTFSFKKVHFKMLLVRCCLFCLNLNALNKTFPYWLHWFQIYIHIIQSSHSSVWHQAIIWTNDDLLSIWLLLWGTNTKIWMGIQTFSFKKVHFKMLLVRCLFCLNLNALNKTFPHWLHWFQIYIHIIQSFE